MKRTVAIVGAAFAVALAVVVGNRMSADAMAVVVGVACGVLASVPTSLLLIWALGRRGRAVSEGERSGNVRGGNQYPPIVVVNPGSGYHVPGYGSLPGLPPAASLPIPSGPRSFRVVGEEATSLEDSVTRLLLDQRLDEGRG